MAPVSGKNEVPNYINSPVQLGKVAKQVGLKNAYSREVYPPTTSFIKFFLTSNYLLLSKPVIYSSKLNIIKAIK